MKIPMDSWWRGTRVGAKIIHDGKTYDVIAVDDENLTVEPRRSIDLGNRSTRALARINRRIV